MFRCRPWRWVWGLLLLAPLYLYVIYYPRVDIENDLRIKAQTALGEAELSWAVPSFEGRDAVISGTAGSEEERRKAHDIVGKLAGVRIAEDRAKLIPLISPFNWTARHKEDKIRIKGYVPTEKDRGAILGIAKATFPDLAIDDGMVLARGVPSREAWLGGVSYSLRLLSYLKRGSVTLTGTDLALQGDPTDIGSYRKIRETLKKSLPAGVTLKSSDISLAIVVPYIWSASIKDGKISIEGFFPDEKTKNSVLGAVKEDRSDLQMQGSPELAAGAPEKFGVVLGKVLPAFLKLDMGDLKFNNADLTIKGTAPDKQTADAISKQLGAKLPAGFTAEINIDFIAPPEPVLPEISPFTFDAKNANGVLTLSGYVQSERARASILAIASAVYPASRVVDKLELGRGAQGEESWLESIRFGLTQFKGLKFGSLDLRDNDLRLAGEAESGTSFSSLFLAIKKAPSGLNLDFTDIRPPLATPYSLNVVLEQERLLLQGNVPDPASRRLLLSVVKNAFKGHEILDRLELASGMPENWLQMVQQGLRQLARLESGSLSLEDQALSFKGVAQFDDTAADISSKLNGALTEGFTLNVSLSSRLKRAQAVQPKRLKEETHVPSHEEEQTPAKLDEQGAAKDLDQTNAMEPARPEQEVAETPKVSNETVPDSASSEEETPSSNDEESASLAEDNDIMRNVSVEASQESLGEMASQQMQEEPTVPSLEVKRDVEPEIEPNVDVAKRAAETSAGPVTPDLCQKLLNSGLSSGMIQFEKDSAILSEESKPLLDKLAVTAKRCQNAKIEIVGHSDADGGKNYNQTLSEARAKSVVDYLVRSGVAADGLSAKGYGEEKPLAPNDTPESKAQNRRIEFKVIY